MSAQMSANKRGGASVIGYKVVRDDYTDCYSGTVRYTVGETVRVDE